MNYVSAIAVDFGSTNSGCARVASFNAEGKLVYTTPEFLQNIGNYAKDNTWFYVEPAFLERIRTDYGSLTDDDFRIESRILNNTENPNIIWGREAIKRHCKKITDEHWASFKRFKMMLYHGDENYAGLDFPLLLIIKTYLRVIKLECLFLESKRLGRQVSKEEIEWGLTIPSIWTDDNKHIMVDLAHEVFTKNTRILSEPEGPLVYSLMVSNAQGKVEYKEGRITFVVDMGGGTTDICLMREHKQENGKWQVEMVANSDGKAAGGNDVDNDFVYYMLRKISQGKVSDSGVSYDSLSDDDLYDVLFADFQTNVGAFIEFEDNWYALKNRPDLNNLTECPFTFTKDYRKWLISNGHAAVAEVVGDYLMDGCNFPTAELTEKVFAPTFGKICSKIREMLEEQKGKGHIDRVVLAGGLSCNQLLNSQVTLTIGEVLGDSTFMMGMGPLMAGGAIAAGACYLLINDEFVIHLAKHNYYYDSFSTSVTSLLKERYASFGIVLKAGEISAKMEDEAEYEISNLSRGQLVLGPVAIKDCLVKKYRNDNLSTSEGQTLLCMEFYLSDEIVIYANKDNPKLKVVAKAEFNCKPDTRYLLEVDFNEAQVSNALRYQPSLSASSRKPSETTSMVSYSYS